MYEQNDEHIFSVWLGDSDELQPELPFLKTVDQLFSTGPSQSSIQLAQTNLLQAISDKLEQVIFYGSFSHQLLGLIHAAVTEKGLAFLDFNVSLEEFVYRIEKKSTRTAIPNIKEVRPFLDQIQQYLDGHRPLFELPIDINQVSKFHRTVLEATRRIPPGQVVTYVEIARRIGKPKAARAVGQALRHNPIPIVIPCHRVIASDGSLRGYKGTSGLKTKALLLKMEGCQLPI